MRMYMYNKCGIHSRLRNIINKSGGYNIYLASKLLMEEYQLNNSEIAYEMAKNENIRNEIDAVGIDAIVDLTRKSLLLRRTNLTQCMTLLKRLTQV